MVFVEVGRPHILAGTQKVVSCRGVWQIFMSKQSYHYLPASGRPTVNFRNLDLVVFALDCQCSGEENNCTWNL